MTSFERNILKKIENKLWIFILMVAFAAGCYVRFMLRSNVSEDMYTYLLNWYTDIKNAGGLPALSEQVGNYNVLYQFIIAIFTYLPIPPVFAYKALSIAFDLLLACITGLYLFDREEKRDCLLGTLGFSLIWLSPVVSLNSSMWGQCDSIYTFFVIAALFSLEKERFNKAFILLGIAFAFKLQAIFILPFFIYRYLSERKFSIVRFLYIPAIMWISTIPAIIAGRGIFTGFRLYFSQTGEYGALTMNSPGFVSLIAYDYQVLHYDELAPIFILLTAVIVGSLIFYALVKKFELKDSSYWSYALLLTYTCVFFLPAMHERYGYIYEIIAIIYCFKNKKAIVPCALLQLISMCTYGYYLMQGTVPLKSLVLLNILVYIMYVCLFFKEEKAVRGGEEE